MMRIPYYSLSLLLGLASIIGFSDGAHAVEYNRRTPIVEAVEKVLPTVVNISTSKIVNVSSSPFPRNFNTPFNDMFNQLFQRQYELEGLGSGVLVEGGYIITNNHVISYDEYQIGPADQIHVTLYKENEQREAYILGANPYEDVAILKLKGEQPAPFLTWGRSDDLMIGETVIAVGSSLGQPFTVTTGIISALNRTIEADQKHLSNLIQTNADINRGNSGGPLVNINGEFIGLNTAILSPSGGSVGLGFALPVSRVRKIYNYWVNRAISLEDQMGVEIQGIDAKIARIFHDQFDSLRGVKLEGVIVKSVAVDGLAAQNLNPLDIIYEVEGKPVQDSEDFLNRLEEHQGSTLSLKAIREGKKITVNIPSPSRTVETQKWQGMELQILDNPWRRWFNLSDQFTGLVILSVEPNSEADKAGIQRGDVLVNLNNQYDLYSLNDLNKARKALHDAKSMVLQTYRMVEKRWQPRQVQIQNHESI